MEENISTISLYEARCYMRTNILVVALGYPTKENPIEGSFFKEQVDFLKNEYDCTVLVYREYCKGVVWGAKRKYSELEYTQGIKQYYPIVYISYFQRCIEIIGSIIRKKRRSEAAVGIYKSELYRKSRKKIINSIIDDLKLEYDVVYCITAQGSAFQALQFAEIKGKPFVISEHRPYPHPGWSTIDVEKEAFEKADCFFAIGKDKIRQIMLQNIKPKRISYLGNLVDESRFIYNPIEHECKTLMIVAAFSYFKNFDMLVETINKLVDMTSNDFRVIIAGYGANKGYVGNVETLEKMVGDSKFSEKTELIREVKRDDICSVYNRADAFVMTSIQEGQPMVALEAACCGLPIFSTKCGGVEDYVTDDIGRLVDITDSDLLAFYLKEFIEGKIKFNNIAIREKVVSIFGRDAFMNRFKSEIDRLL